MKYKRLLVSAAVFCSVLSVQGENQLAADTVPSADVSVQEHNVAAADIGIVSSHEQAAKTLLDGVDTWSCPVLEDADFAIGSVHRGDSLAQVRRAFGSPVHYEKSDHFTKIKYDDEKQSLRLVLCNDTADALKESKVQTGVDSLVLTKGKDVLIGGEKQVHLQYPAESLLRKFGRPDNVLRDADANVYYFVYQSPDKASLYVFAVANRHVERVALMPVRMPYMDNKTVLPLNKKSERDFTLMGFGLNQPFEANKYNMWTNLVQRKNNDFWLYGNYGIEVDRRNTIKKVFLLTNNAYTSRGATLGYHISTVLSLYGRPDRVEIGPDKKDAVDAYYYDSPYQKGVSLVFVVTHDEKHVDDILLTSEPVQNLQDPMGRYGLKE